MIWETAGLKSYLVANNTQQYAYTLINIENTFRHILNIQIYKVT